MKTTSPAYVRLRPFVAGDAQALAAQCQRWPGNTLESGLPFACNTAATYVNDIVLAAVSGHCLSFAIEEIATGLLIGEVRMSLREAGLSYWLAPPFRGRGHMRPVLTQFLAVARCAVGEVMVTADVVRENLPSRRTLEGAGFRFQYLHRQDWAPSLRHVTLLRYARAL